MDSGFAKYPSLAMEVLVLNFLFSFVGTCEKGSVWIFGNTDMNETSQVEDDEDEETSQILIF
jgi:hypothetical protein